MSFQPTKTSGEKLLGALAAVLALGAMVAASMYLFTPAGALPPFMPGYRLHAPDIQWHLGFACLAASLVLFGLTWVLKPTH